MKIDALIWNRALQFERIFLKRGKKLSRKTLSNELMITDNEARFLLIALENKGVISKKASDLQPISGYTLVISDIHIPFQDDSSLLKIWDFCRGYNITRIIVLGDLIDFYKESIFRKDPNKKDAKFEIESAKKFLVGLRNRFPDSEIIYKQGNHEERLENYILDKAPELFNLLENLLQEKLGLKELNIQYIIDPFKIGHLWCLHGHEKPKGQGNPEYITNVMFKYINDNFICGHWHREQTKLFPHISGKRFQGTCIGWVGDYMQIDYCRHSLRTDSQGFALIEFDDMGRFKTKPFKFVEGEIF